MTNPFLKHSRNVTEIMRLTKQQPELAARLEAEAEAEQRREEASRRSAPAARPEVVRALAGAVQFHQDKGGAGDGDLRTATCRIANEAEHAAALRVLGGTAGRNPQGRWFSHSYTGPR